MPPIDEPSSRATASAREPVIYTPDSALRDPRRLLREMLADLRRALPLAGALALRNVLARYRQSLLGLLWAFAPALVMAAGCVLARNAKILVVADTELPYPAYVMLSTVLWQTFHEAVTGPVQAVVGNRALLARLNFPREAVPLATLAEVLFNFAVKLVLVAGLFLWYRLPVPWTAVLAPLALLHLALLGIALGTLLAPIGALYGDVPRALTIVLGLWLFLTPVVYPIPESGPLAVLVTLNPVTPLLVSTRELTALGALSMPLGLAIAVVGSWLALGIAWLVFRLGMPFVVERVSA